MEGGGRGGNELGSRGRGRSLRLRPTGLDQNWTLLYDDSVTNFVVVGTGGVRGVAIYVVLHLWSTAVGTWYCV